MSVNSFLTGDWRKSNAILRCESLSVDNAINQNVSDLVVLRLPNILHTFDADINNVFIFAIETEQHDNFNNTDVMVSTITINNIKPNTLVKASILQVVDILGGIADGNKMSSFINYEEEGVYNIYITNLTNFNEPFTGRITLMLEQIQRGNP